LESDKRSLIHSLRLFCSRQLKSIKLRIDGVTLNAKEAKDLLEVLRELSLSRKETVNTLDSAMRGFTEELSAAQKLWRRGNNSFLIKVGLALIAFPDPTITDVIGSALVAAGLIQLRMRRSALYLEDVYKTFPRVIKELDLIKQYLV